MYVLCVGMYRSCSTWQYEIVSHLLEAHRASKRLGFQFGHQFEERRQAPATTEWLTLKSHEGHPSFARALAEGSALAVYSYRDLRDVAFSLMHKFDLTFDDMLSKDRLLDSCLDSDAFWTGQPHVLSQRYEDIIADPVSAISALAAHLQVPLCAGEAEDLARAYSFEANQKRAVSIRKRLSAEGVDLSRHEFALANDPHTLLHWNHLRAGGQGGWRQEANQHERSELARICGEWLMSRGYERDLNWVNVSIEDVWRQFDCVRAELARARRQIIVLEKEQVELEKTRDKLAGALANLESARAELETERAQFSEQRTRHLRELEHALRPDPQVEQMRTKLARLEELGPVTLQMAQRWRHLAKQHPRTCAVFRPMARKFLRLLAS
jgi:hypothetical protein